MCRRASLSIVVASVLVSSCVANSNLALSRDGQRVAVNPPSGWVQYGRARASDTTEVVLIPTRSIATAESGIPTASIRLELGSGDCQQVEANIKSQRLQFGQRLVLEDTKSRIINKQETNVFHAENELADYYYVCLPLRNKMH